MRPGAIVCALLLAACTVTIPKASPTAPPLRLGVTGGWHGQLAENLAHLNTYGTEIILRAPVRSVEEAHQILGAVRPASHIRVLWLIEVVNGPLLGDLLPILTAGPPTYGVELGNELDLAGVTPQAFGAWVRAAYDLLRGNGFTGAILSGAVYSVRPESLRYLLDAGMPGWPPDLIAGLHRYGDPDDGQRGYDSRTQETNVLKALGRPIAVTEFGYPQHTPADETWAAAAAQRDLAWFHAAGASIACWYQITDGPTTADIDRYGLHALDGHWRPVTNVFQP